MGPVFVKILWHGVVHDEVEGCELPVCPIHGQVPQFKKRQFAVIERIDYKYKYARHSKTWNIQANFLKSVKMIFYLGKVFNKKCNLEL